jgi:hypothetical protein
MEVIHIDVGVTAPVPQTMAYEDDRNGKHEAEKEEAERDPQYD